MSNSVRCAVHSALSLPLVPLTVGSIAFSCLVPLAAAMVAMETRISTMIVSVVTERMNVRVM